MRKFQQKDLAARFRSFVTAKDLILPGDRLLAAHSGGTDSTFLFEMLLASRYEIGFEFIAGHVNHGLRGKSADEDEKFVKGMCDREGIEFHRREVSIADIRERDGISIEMAARRLRYDALEDMASSAGCNKVAFAHQADDRVETFLLRLMKGAGPDALSSIPLRRPMGSVELIRPLFAFHRNEIIEWLYGNSVEYRTDETNLDKAIARNAVREQLIPMMRERFNPSIGLAIIRAIEALERDSDYLNRIASDEAMARISETPGGVEFDMDGLGIADAPIIIRMLLETFDRLAGDEYRCGYDQIMASVGLWTDGKRSDRIDFPQGWTVVRTPTGLLLRATPEFKPPPEINPADLPVIGEGMFRLPEIFIIVASVKPRGEIGSVKLPPPDTVYLNVKLAGNIKADYNRSGRDMKPLGMDGHTRKVSDILMEAGVPLHRREWIPVLTAADDESDVVAIPHLGLIADRARVGDNDERVLVVEISPPLGDAIP